MHDKLVSYLLGELDADEAAEFEQQLRDDPQLAAELERVRKCLESTDDCDEAKASVPAGLAERTADSVVFLSSQFQADSIEPPTRRYSFSMLDATVAIGVVLAVGLILLPALSESRASARRIACQNNLREIGLALRAYAADHAGYFPMPPQGANIGTFTITLSKNGYIDRHALARYVVCPSSPEASQVAAGEIVVRIPRSFDELEAADHATQANLRRVMALNIAGRLPCQGATGLHPIRDGHGSRAPLLSDAPTIINGQWRSMNHGGYGLNVLYQDGRVKYHLDFRDPVRDDHLFVNAEGKASMPSSPDDAVLVRSEYIPMTPCLMPAKIAPLRLPVDR